MQPTNFKDDSIEKKYNVGGDWLTLVEGDNKVRIVTELYDFPEHYLPNLGKSQACIGKDCPICNVGIKQNGKFMCYAFDRGDENKLKIFKFSYTIFKAIKGYALSEDYGFDKVIPYDLTIQKEGQKMMTRYNVIPARQNTELTDQEKAMVKEKVEGKSISDIIEAMVKKASQTEFVPETSEDINTADVGSTVEDESINSDDIPF